jgi:hypothetical protein
MSNLVTQYKNVSGLMYSIETENADNSNAGLLQVSQCKSQWHIFVIIKIKGIGSRV